MFKPAMLQLEIADEVPGIIVNSQHNHHANSAINHHQHNHHSEARHSIDNHLLPVQVGLYLFS